MNTRFMYLQALSGKSYHHIITSNLIMTKQKQILNLHILDLLMTHMSAEVKMTETEHGLKTVR